MADTADTIRVEIRALTAQGKTGQAAVVEREFAAWHHFEEEQTVLHNRIVLNHTDPGPWFELGRLYASRGLWVDARRMTLSGLQRSPNDAAGRRLLRQIETHGR